MTTLQAQIVGRAVADRAREDLVRASREEGVIPMLRIRGLEKEEIEHAARSLSETSLQNGGDLQLKISDREPWPDCPVGWFLAPGESRAKLRNSCTSALVLFDHEEEPDEQSLRNMHSLSDSAVLGDVHGAERRDRVLDLVWESVTSKETKKAPQTLGRTCQIVFEAFQIVTGEVSLRQWVGFLLEACKKLSGRSVVDESDVSEAVSESLVVLGLFPDPDLFQSKPAGVRRRIVKNGMYASLCTESGREYSEEELEKRIDEVIFQDPAGGEYGESENERWRGLCRALVHSLDGSERREIPFRIWSQLFDKDARKRKLGELLRDQIERVAPDRLGEFDDLDVKEGLDEGDQSAAESLLKKDSDDVSSPPLADLLTRPQRRAVEKIANPTSPFTEDPLSALLRALHSETATDHLDLTDSKSVDLRFGLDSAVEELPVLSLAAFRFLFGSVLRDVFDGERPASQFRFIVDDVLMSGDCNFVRHANLLRKNAKPADQGEGESEEIDLTPFWSPLRLVLERDGIVVARFTWRPEVDTGKVAFARVVCEEGPWTCFEATEASLDEWCGRSLDPGHALGARNDVPDGVREFVKDWNSTRSERLRSWAGEGLSVDGLKGAVDAWKETAARVRLEVVPRGARVETLDFFLELDTLKLSGNRTVLLATHPLRLRWIFHYLEDLSRKLNQALEGEFQINEDAEDFFFQHQQALSPHRQPPVISTGHGEVSIAAREYGWHEEYARIETTSGPTEEWMSALDDASVDEMAVVVNHYLEAHPHKVDGLAILFFAVDGEATHVERLVRRILRSGPSELTLRVHVIAPILAFDEIARVLESLDDGQRTLGRLLPRLQTFLHSEELVRDPTQSGLESRIDLALVPNLFGKKTSVFVQTRKSGRGRGVFRPLLDSTSYDLQGSEEDQGGNVSRALIPEAEDDLLEPWSTLSVWRKAESPVAQEGEDMTDLFALQVRFTESLGLFRSLHTWAHWVVTLDPYVGREQIEAIKDRPDVITVKPNVGKNGNYTLVVSSSAGRHFVVTRLARKLEWDLQVAVGPQATALAERIYENGRSFAPGVVLRALGLGRTSHELVGLVVARWAVVERLPRPGDDVYEFEAWLSLDEHARWFGGMQAQRADMLRVLGSQVNGGLRLEFQVVEAKFRSEEYLGHAVTQVERTLALVRRVFAGRGSEEAGSKDTADAAFWRLELLDAIQQSASRTRDGAIFTGLQTKSMTDGDSREGLSARVRRDIRDGLYEVVDCRGIICSVAYGTEITDNGESTRVSGFERIRVGRARMKEILEAFGQGGEPRASSVQPFVPLDSSADVFTEQVRETTFVATAPSSNVGKLDNRLSRSSEIPAGSRGLGQERLHDRYQRILDTFASFDVKVSKPEDGLYCAEGPAFYQTRVVPARGVKSDIVMSQSSELKLALGLPSELSIRAFVDRGAVTFQIPKVIEERYFVVAQDLWKTSPPDLNHLAVPIGEDVHGGVVVLDFSDDSSPHLLIGGTTGSGKSVVMESILAGLCYFHPPERLRLELVDPKRTELRGFENDPHLLGSIGYDSQAAMRILDAAVEEMERRYELLHSKACRDIVGYNSVVPEEQKMVWRLLVLDEYADLTAEKAERLEVETKLKRLAQKSRAAGIHIIVATQKPSAEILSTAIRSNLPAQIALRVKSAVDSRMIIDESGAETLAGKGDALFKTARGSVRMQCSMVRR